MIVDSLIVAAISGFSIIVITSWPPDPQLLWAAVMAFLLTFFTQLGVERGAKFHEHYGHHQDDEREND